MTYIHQRDMSEFNAAVYSKIVVLGIEVHWFLQGLINKWKLKQLVKLGQGGASTCALKCPQFKKKKNLNIRQLYFFEKLHEILNL